ncbi:hypothetical protein L218DRAFT_1010583 [Marasmius fiardii PR-910]|nr:hypothetical protein L218DRAFT_1010583 [Marasmius fiardii PR-910]
MIHQTLPKGPSPSPAVQAPAASTGTRAYHVMLSPVCPKTQVESKLAIAVSPFNEDVLVSVGELYSEHESILPPDLNKRVPNFVKLTKGPFIYLEAQIDTAKFELLISVSAPEWAKTKQEIKKRKKGIEEDDMNILVSKKLKSKPSQLISNWVAQPPARATQVSLIFAQFTKDELGEQITWPNLDADIVTGFLANEEFDNRATKLVYKLTIGNVIYAAKRIDCICEGEAKVSIAKNHQELEAEGIQLYQLNALLTQFQKCTKRKTNVDDS